jgi:hypothetical protein
MMGISSQGWGQGVMRLLTLGNESEDTRYSKNHAEDIVRSTDIDASQRENKMTINLEDHMYSDLAYALADINRSRVFLSQAFHSQGNRKHHHRRQSR